MIQDLTKRMDGALATLNKEFGSLRTGRASTNLLDSIQIEAYGSMLPMVQVGNVTAPEARMLMVVAKSPLKSEHFDWWRVPTAAAPARPAKTKTS